MFIRLRKSKAQSTAEYAMVVTLVIGALVGAQVTIQRRMKAKLSDTSLAVAQAGAGASISWPEGGSVTLGSTTEWEPEGVLRSDYSVSQASDSNQTVEQASHSRNETSITGRLGNQTTLRIEEETPTPD